MKIKLILTASLLILSISVYLSFQLFVFTTSEDSLIEIEIPKGASYRQALADKDLIRDGLSSL